MGVQRDLRRAGRQEMMVMHKNKMVDNGEGKLVKGGLAVGETLTFRDGTGYVVNANGSVRRAVPKQRR